MRILLAEGNVKIVGIIKEITKWEKPTVAKITASMENISVSK